MHFFAQYRLSDASLFGYNCRTGLGSAAETHSPATTPQPTEGAANMDVRGIGSVPGTSPLRPRVPAAGSRDTLGRPSFAPQDEMRISSAGKAVAASAQPGDLRAARLEQIRAAIANGTYDTDDKLESALRKMVASFTHDEK